jgi:hypothetical protein
LRDSRNIIVLSIVAFIAIIGIVVMLFAPAIMNNFSDNVGFAAHSVYPSFAAPESRFTINGNTISVSDTAIYKTGYYSINGGDWQDFTLTGTTLNGSWLSSSATYTLPTFPAGENYIVIYSCNKTSGVWDCHDNKWQLQIINITASSSSFSWTGELMNNGDFEQGNLNYWTTSGSYWTVGAEVINGKAGVHDGNYCAFTNGSSDSAGFIYQDVNLTSYSFYIDSGTAIVNASGWGVSSESPVQDLSRIQIFFLNSTKGIIATASDSGVVDNPTWWQKGISNYVIPSGTRYIRMWGNTYETGHSSGNLDSFSIKIGYGGTIIPPVCTNACSSNQCYSSTAYKTCSDINGDGCNELSAAITCPNSGTCSSAGICSTSSTSDIGFCLSSGYNCGNKTISGSSRNCGTCTDGLSCTNNICVSSGKTLYVATNGNDGNNGDIAHPFATLEKAWSYVSAGDIIYMRGGNYRYTTTADLEGRSGSIGKMINIWAYPGEHPIINYSGVIFPSQTQCFGIFLRNDNYVRLKGIRVTGAAQVHELNAKPNYGMILWDNVNNCIFEQMETDHIGGWGVMVGQNSDNDLFLNCDSHHNADPYSTADPYGGADGFETGSHGTVTSTNIIFRGCRAWGNSDDGWDLRQADGVYTLENCWSFHNGFREDQVTPGGNGEGFKLGGKTAPASTTIIRTVRNCLAFEDSAGFTPEPDSPDLLLGVEVYNSVSYNNYGIGINFEYNNYAILRNNIVYNNAAGNMYGWGPNVVHDHNVGVTSDLTYTVTDADFQSLNSTVADGPRQADGSLPNITFLHLKQGSKLIGAGVNVGLTTDGAGNMWKSTPSIGAFEYYP